MVIEGMLALTGQHFIIDYNERMGTLPGFVEGFSNVARDEHRHIAFGVRFLTDCVKEDERYREVIQKMLEQSLPVADGVIEPPWPEEEDNTELFGASPRGDARLRRSGARPAPEGDWAHLAVARRCLTFFLGAALALCFLGAE